MALSEGEKRWLSDKDFGLRRAVKAENNIYNRNDIVYDKRGFLCTYGKETVSYTHLTLPTKLEV